MWHDMNFVVAVAESAPQDDQDRGGQWSRAPLTDPATRRPESVVSGGHMLRWPFGDRDSKRSRNASSIA